MSLKFLEELDKTMKPLLKSLEEQKKTFDGLINSMPEQNQVTEEVRKEINGLLKNITPSNALKTLQRLRELEDGYEDNSK